MNQGFQEKITTTIIYCIHTIPHNLFIDDLQDAFLAELFRGMLFKWKGENKKSHQK